MVFVCHSDPERSDGEESPHLFLLLQLSVLLSTTTNVGMPHPESP
jgi:hypothetical protein